MLIPKVENRIRQHLVVLDRHKYSRIGALNLEVMETQEHFRTPPDKGSWAEAKLPYDYGREWTYYWFRSRFDLPEAARDREAYLRIQPNADSLVFIDRKPLGAVNPFHDILRLPNVQGRRGPIELHMESYAGHKYPGMHPLMEPAVILTLGAHIDDYPNRFARAEIVLRNEAIYSLFYDAAVLFEVAQELPESSLRRNKILSGLYHALTRIPLDASTDTLSVAAAEAGKAIAPLLAAKNGDSTPEIHLIGHAHIDHAWLWPISETEHKAARTFANMAHYAEEYPEFIFVQSQPAQLDIVRREYPEIFASVRAAYERGQWEPNGGMWIEADCNITGGEALIRQFLVGKKATREMLGYEGDTLWLPDVFGYAAALPQILEGCEIDYFVTSKINWNDTTRFPYDTFLWRGIDGTGVKTHYITARKDGYNGRVKPSHLLDAWNQVQHKEVQDGVIKSIGEGDGGGGTRRSDLESARRLGNLEGAPKASWRKVSDALHRVFERAGEVPEWRGELYLELHRGTYTTQAKTKRYNRKLELALRECELFSSLAALLPSRNGSKPPAYPREELEVCWKMLLTNQFHDIIPGSSINRVYRDAEAAYREIEKSTADLTARAKSYLASRLAAEAASGEAGRPSAGRSGALAAFNPLSWMRESLVLLPSGTKGSAGTELVSASGSSPVQMTRDIDDHPAAHALASVPALGAAACRLAPGAAADSAFHTHGTSLETPFYKVQFDSAGRIGGLTDKSDGRQFVARGRALNALQTAPDIPVLWDAWDIDSDWVQNIQSEERLESTEVVSDGPLFHQIRRRYRIGEVSSLVQDTIFYAKDRRIDFVTKIEWHESHRILKAAFPVDVTTNQVRCEVQYGHVIRNTHDNLPTDRAQFEVCSHKWMCVEESGHGAAVLNDSKYGCDVRGSVMRLTLLRSPKAPDAEADMGTHYVTYSFLPYAGSFVSAKVVQAAYELNCPLTAVEAGEMASASGEAAAISLFAVDNPNVVVEAVKLPEEAGSSGAVVLRLYESAGGAQTASIATTFDIRGVSETNMLERKPKPARHEKRSISLSFRPFEIKTLMIELLR